MAKYGTGGVAFKWEGVPELKRNFNQLALALGPDGMGTARAELKEILMKPALTIRDEARDLAPVKTGKMQSAIYASKGADNKPGVVVGVDALKAPYARFVERGTSKMPASPFFRPAINATRPLIANMIAGDLKKLIEELATKNGFHPG
jgi:HK97 gp10 family phage protein